MGVNAGREEDGFVWLDEGRVGWLEDERGGRAGIDDQEPVGTGGAGVLDFNQEFRCVARTDRLRRRGKKHDIQGLCGAGGPYGSNLRAVALGTGGDVAKLGNAAFGDGNNVTGKVSALSGKIGEKMELRRTGAVNVSPGVVSSYVHNQVAPGLGKIGVLVALKSSGDATKLAALGRQIAMHVAAANPVALNASQVDAALIEREKAIFADQARASGKPENIIAKMVEGRLRKFYEEVCLLEQNYIMDPDKKVSAVVKDAEKDVGAPVSLEGFVRYALGEGIQKVESDFAAEVAAAAKG